MAQRKIDLLFWGYVASVLQSMLRPYIKGSALLLTTEEKEVIEHSKRFIDSMLRGCDTINTPGALSLTHTYNEVPPAAALNLAMNIFLSMAIEFPKDLDALKEKLSKYIKILEKVKESQAIEGHEQVVAQEVSSFFQTLSDKADQESYESVYSL